MNEFQRRAEAWEEHELLRWSLDLLCVFECCGTLPLEALQRFLKRVLSTNVSAAPTRRVRSSELRRLLASVDAELVTTSEGDLQLRHADFARFCRERYLGPEDLLDVVQSVVGWLGADARNAPDLAAEFLAHWATLPQPRDPDLEEQLHELPRLLADHERFASLRRAAELLRGRGAASWADHCLDEAVRAGDFDALKLQQAARRTEPSPPEGADQAPSEEVPKSEPPPPPVRAPAMPISHGALSFTLGLDSNDIWFVGASLRAIQQLSRDLNAGPYGRRRIHRGMGRLTELASAGDVDAMTMLGGLLLMLDPPAADFERGVGWLLAACRGGSYVSLDVLQQEIFEADVPRAQQVARLEVLFRVQRQADLGRTPSGRAMVPVAAAPQPSVERSDAGTSALEEACRAGDPDAMLELGQRLLDGEGDGRRARRGLQLLQRAARAGSASAHFEIGRRLMHGLGLHPDPHWGLHALFVATGMGHPGAAFALAEHVMGRRWPRLDPWRARWALAKAARAGDLDAMTHLARLWLEGPVAMPSLGVALLREAADAAHRPAMVELGTRLISSAESRAHVERGIELLLRACPADDPHDAAPALPEHEQDSSLDGRAWRCLTRASALGFTEPLYVLGKRLLDRGHARRDHAHGLSLLERAVAAGSASATRELGRRLMLGERVPRDEARGEDLLTARALAGDTKAMTALGVALLQLERTELALMWLGRALDRGSTRAMRALADHLIDHGDGDAALVRGVGLLDRACDAGDVSAMSDLGRRMLEGDVVEHDLITALCLLRFAAARGDAPAMAQLAERMLEGENVARDRRRGAQWLERAAAAGDPEAMANLVDRLLHGDGMAPAPTRARALLARLAESGNTDAVVELALDWLASEDDDSCRERGESLLRHVYEPGAGSALTEMALQMLDDEDEDADPRLGARLLAWAGENGDLDAMVHLGTRLLYGQGLRPNLQRARELLAQASERGHVIACLHLGAHLLQVSPPTGDSERGFRLLRLAAAAGNREAAELLEELSLV